MIPHVTQFDEADITEPRGVARRAQQGEREGGHQGDDARVPHQGERSRRLQKFPDFNASLSTATTWCCKQYFNIGFAADTPNGLVVPVIRNADQKGVLAIAKEMGELSAKAREGKLGPADMQGGCFSISSLGGIGGTAFTPIINAPEVAILGVSKSATKPVWDGKAFVPRLMLPLSLSYDHRVIDGAAAARFTAYLASLLADLRRTVALGKVGCRACQTCPIRVCSLPIMGMTSAAPSLAAHAPGLRTRWLLLDPATRSWGCCFGQRERELSMPAEIIARTGSGSGAVQRELARLEQSGLVTVRRIGTQKATIERIPQSPLFE